MNAAIYARYSTDKQREASLADQARLCRTWAVSNSCAVVAEHFDETVSGSTPVEARQGGATLLADALAGRFSVLIVEGLDRLSRDSVQQETLVRRLEHNGVRIVGVSDGYDSLSKSRKLHRGMRGLINEIYLDDLRDKVHRGLTGLAMNGCNAGGLPYGYVSTATDAGHRLAIDPDKAKWVEWMYGRYTDGWSPQKIAYALNAKHVPAPRGKTWAVSALYGNPKQQTGILRNPIYMGRYIWNRSQWIKDESGKRKRRERPASEWHVVEHAHLRIVPAALWTAAQARLNGHNKTKRGKPARTALSGLLKCGTCGGAVVAVNARLYGCAANKDRGPTVCAGIHVRRDVLESGLVDILRDDLLSDDSIARLRREVATLQAEHGSAGRTEQKAIKARLRAVESEVENLVNAVASAGWSQALRDRLQKAETEKAELLAASIATPLPKPAVLMPRLIDHYKAMVARLPGELKRDPAAAREALREVFTEVRLSKKNGEIWAEMPDFPLSLIMVAGVGFEPTTFGL